MHASCSDLVEQPLREEKGCAHGRRCARSRYDGVRWTSDKTHLHDALDRLNEQRNSAPPVGWPRTSDGHAADDHGHPEWPRTSDGPLKISADSLFDTPHDSLQARGDDLNAALPRESRKTGGPVTESARSHSHFSVRMYRSSALTMLAIQF